MAQQAGSFSYVPASGITPAKLVLHDGLTNYTFTPYTGPPPVAPADLAALQAHIDAQVTALQTAIAAIATTLASKPAGIDFDPSTGGSWLWLAPPGVTAPATTPNGTKLTGNVLQLLTS